LRRTLASGGRQPTGLVVWSGGLTPTARLIGFGSAGLWLRLSKRMTSAEWLDANYKLQIR